MMSSLDKWAADIARQYQEAVERGEHDEQCEYHVEGFYLCHCSKRRREARGIVEPPFRELYFPPPSCTECDADLDNDDGHWRCYTCKLTWDPSGCNPEFTDVYGETLAEDSQRWFTAYLSKTSPAEVSS